MRGRGQRPSSEGAWLEAEVHGRSLVAQGPRRRGSRLGPSRALGGGGGGGVGGSRAANGRAPLEQLQKAGARPRRRRGGGARREARLAEEKLRPGPGRATNSGGGTMEAAAAVPHRRQLLIVLLAAATLLPGAKGEWRAGGCGARGPGPASGSLQLFLKHGAGPGAQVAAPARPGFPDPAGATRAGAGRRGGAEAVSSAGGRAPSDGRPSWALGGSGWRACRDQGLPSGVRGRPGP